MMDMPSRNQYLKQLRRDYLKAKSKKARSELLDEAEKRTELERKYLIKKLKPKSNLDQLPSERKRRKQYYDNQTKAALAECWKIFDHPCGQRLVTSLRTETDRLRKFGELICSDETAVKLKKISFRTIDEKLKHQKEVERQKRKYCQRNNPLLYQKIPVKVSDEQDRTRLGNIQIDLVEHCGASASGEYLNTLSTTDLLSNWWEGEAIMGRGRIRTNEALELIRNRYPFAWLEIHSDNGTEFINWHLFGYCQETGLGFSRSRPYKKNDNYLVEQKNWTHVKKFVGYRRYDTEEEQAILNDLYRNELRLYKNFFQPVIKLKSKVRVGGRIRRRYSQAKTPYQRVMELNETSQKTKDELKRIYDSLNPAQLKREIDRKLNLLWRACQQKQDSNSDDEFLKVEIIKKIKPRIVRNYVARPEVISVS